MNEPGNEKLRELLRAAMPPVGDADPPRDLWPRMLRRLDQRPAPASWFDWALAAALVAWFFVFPETIPGVFYIL